MNDTAIQELSRLKSPFSTAVEPLDPLRIAIILDEAALSEADCRLIDELLSAPGVRVAAVVARRPRSDGDARGLTAPAELLMWLYRMLDEHLNGTGHTACTLDLLAGRIGADVLIVDSGQNDQLVGAQLRARFLDVILNIQGLSGVGHFAAAARCGLWWTGASGEQIADSELAYGFAATASGRMPVRLVLWALDIESGGALALEFATSRLVSRISALKNMEPLKGMRRNLWLAGLRALQAHGWEALKQRSENASSSIGPITAAQQHPRERIDTFAVVNGLIGMAAREVKHRRKYFKHRELWRVGIRKLESSGLNTDTDGYRWLSAPARRWYADPFLFASGSREYLFMEEFDEQQQQGRIVCAQVNGDGSVAGAQVVLQKPYHLSYPHVFAHAGEIFMIPETGFQNTVELYRATEFPWSWEFIRVLYAGPAFDTTMFVDNGRFWFFTTLIEDPGRYTAQLFLFHSQRVDGDWTMHPLAPVSNDVRCARGAGTVLRFGSSCLRPSQDGSRTYGGAVRFQKIETINERTYSERFFCEINPSAIPRGVGIHTYNRSTIFEAVDSRVLVATR